MKTLEGLAQGVMYGDVLSISRALTIVESSNGSESEMLLKYLENDIKKSYTIGVTGPPGAGKSTLINCLISQLCEENFNIGVIVIDPSSPLSGGAVLGDRIRIQSFPESSGVFIRSAATRGHLGGVTRATYNMVKIFVAAGKDVIIVETVGTGQSEVDMVNLSHTNILVEVPGLGDEIQTMKGGILEIADILVLNKADSPDAEQTAMQYKKLYQEIEKNGWNVPVIKTIAKNSSGIKELVNAIKAHWNHVDKNEKTEELVKIRIQTEVNNRVKDMLFNQIIQEAKKSGQYEKIIKGVLEYCYSPEKAAQKIIDLWKKR